MKKCILFLCLLVSTSLNAITYVYTGTGDWTDVANWNTYPAPSNGLVTINSGDFVQVPFGSDLNINVTILNTGTFEIYGNATNSSSITNSGTFFIFGTFAENSNFTAIGTIKASGIYGGNLENLGMLQPRGPAGVEEILDLFGDLDQDNGSTVHVEIRGNGGPGNPNGHSMIDVWGTAFLDGTLKITLDNYSPSVGDEFTLMYFFSRSGTFQTLVLPDISPLIWDLDYEADEIILRVDAAVAHKDFQLEALVQDKDVLLEWKNQSDEYRQFFIERKVDEEWQNIAVVNSDWSPSYLDSDVDQGMQYYRVVGERYDGIADWSDIKVVHIQEELELSIFPNPVSDFVTVIGLEINEAPVKIYILDHLGRNILEQTFTGSFDERDIKINVSSLPNGHYYIGYLMNDQLLTEKFIVQK